MKHIESHITILSPEEIEQIHQATLDALSTVGCRMPHPQVQALLKERGAEVEEKTGIIYMPAAMLERSVREVKKAPVDPGMKPFRRGPFGIHPGNQALIIDYQAVSRRLGTVEDVIRGIVLCNELPFVHGLMPLVTPMDVPAALGDLYGYYLCTLYARKPYSVYICSPETARQVIRMWEMVRHEPARAGFNPTIGYLLEPNGSLSFDRHSLEMALIFARAGHEVWVGPMAMAGLDAPVTLAGTLVMQNAYNLAGIALAWALGIRGSWSGSAHTLDLRHALCSFGSPNQVLIGLAAVQLGAFYGFEAGLNSALTDACLPDFQSGFEKGMSGITALLSGADGIGAQGIVGADQGTSFEQLVIDNEWASALDHIFSRGFEVNEETLGLEVIRRVGVGGSYIADEHTVRHMRNTYWKASIFNQASWDAWMAEGGKDLYARAHEKVEAILSCHYPPQPLISEQSTQALEALMNDAQAHLERFEL